jgi:hypothetical protein
LNPLYTASLAGSIIMGLESISIQRVEATPRPSEHQTRILRRQALVGTVATKLEEVSSALPDLDPSAAATIVVLGFFSPEEADGVSRRRTITEIQRNVLSHGLSRKLADDILMLIPGQLKQLEQLRLVREHSGEFSLRFRSKPGTSTLIAVRDVQTLLEHEFSPQVVLSEHTLPQATTSQPSAPRDPNEKVIRKLLRKVETIERGHAAIQGINLLGAHLSPFSRGSYFHGSSESFFQSLSEGIVQPASTEPEEQLGLLYGELLAIGVIAATDSKRAQEELTLLQDSLDPSDYKVLSQLIFTSTFRNLTPPALAEISLRGILMIGIGSSLTEAHGAFDAHRFVLNAALLVAEESSPQSATDHLRCCKDLERISTLLVGGARPDYRSSPKTIACRNGARQLFAELTTSGSYLGIEDFLTESARKVRDQVATLRRS